MLEISSKTNLLEQATYKYSLQDVAEPNLYRDIYSYDDVPKIAFNHRRVPMAMPEDIWITDTSFRDGQQSVNPYTVEQIVVLILAGDQTDLLSLRQANAHQRSQHRTNDEVEAPQK